MASEPSLTATNDLAVDLSNSQWYADWQHTHHAALFDARHALSRVNLARNYEVFNDLRLLSQQLDRARSTTLLEVGCATGEFYRYLRFRQPQVHYTGVDISRGAIDRAKAKYPKANVMAVDPNVALAGALLSSGLDARHDILCSKDVIHHQIDPLGLLSQFLRLASDGVVIRTRTRDVGATVLDPELSCQYHYDGWMPYIVLNLHELLDHIRKQVPTSDITVHRHHMVLGGREGRFLPKDCYLPATGTAETAVSVSFSTANPGRMVIEDRVEAEPVYTTGYRAKSILRRMFGKRS